MMTFDLALILHSDALPDSAWKSNLARPFNVLGCTLEGNQLRNCAAKPIASGYRSKQVGFYTRRALIQGPTEYESDGALRQSLVH